MAERCEKDATLAASFFFYRTKSDRSNARRIFPTIAYQLTKFIPSTKPAIMRTLRSDLSILDKSLREQLQMLIIRPLVTLAEPLCTIMTVIIDALDECEDGSLLAEVISLISEVLDDSIRIPLRFLFTSRPEAHLCHIFENPRVTTKTRSLSLDHLDSRDSIRVYLRRGFNDTLGNQRLQSETLCARLVDLADGSFIYASTALRFITENRSHNRHSHDPHTIISTLERGIDSLYRRILSMHPYDDGERLIIGTILLLRSHLSLADIAILLGLRPATILRALYDLHSIFYVPDQASQPVRIFHTSLYDFLTHKQRSGPYFIDPRQHHTNIARSCLKLMTRRLKRDMMAVEDVGDMDAQQEDVEILSGDTLAGDPLVGASQYACCFWAFHLSLADNTTELLSDVREFALTKALCWTEALGIIGKLGTVERSLLDAVDWLAVRFSLDIGLGRYSRFRLK